MPCYQIITSTITFRVDNIDLLKRAIEKEQGYLLAAQNKDILGFKTKDGKFIRINFKDSTITAEGMDEKELSTTSNSLKRAYSSIVIDEIAKKQRWMKKKLNETTYQLQRF